MSDYDLFNGDADGLCALRQLRLHDPRSSALVTGVKREVSLLSRVCPAAGDRLTVLDVSLDANREALRRALDAGAQCLYFDHHYPGDVPRHPALETHIDYVAGTCTSLIVDQYLAGRYRAWAVVAAFGDNLRDAALAAARPLQLSQRDLDLLRRMGECLNYNAYGDSVADLHFHPEALYLRLAKYADPLEFVARDAAFDTLQRGYDEDMARAAQVAPVLDTPVHLAVVLPDAAWARRVSGPWANHLATASPQRAHAVMVRKGQMLSVSLRAPVARPGGADLLARQFESGGGRPAAAGINALPEAELPRLLRAFEQHYRDDGQ